MNKSILTTLTVLSTLSLSACSTTPRAPLYTVQANVQEVKAAPEVCRYKPDHQASNRVGKSLVGGLLGGIIGHQFGQGKGKKVMTVLGSAAGYIAATDLTPYEKSKMDCRTDGYLMRVSYIHPETNEFTTKWLPINNYIRAKTVTIPVRGITNTP